MRFDEWHPWPGLPSDDFVEGMDKYSLASSNPSMVLADAWEMEELSESGPVLELSRLWMHPDHAKGNASASVAEALVRRRCEGRFSVFVLNAFPLEYEHAVREGSPLERGFASCRRAAERLFAWVLGCIRSRATTGPKAGCGAHCATARHAPCDSQKSGRGRRASAPDPTPVPRDILRTRLGFLGLGRGSTSAERDHGADSFRAVYRPNRGRVPPWAMPFRTIALLILTGLALATALIFATEAATAG